MALASGKLVIPVSLDGKVEELPGWMDGFQAIKCHPLNSFEEQVDLIAQQLRLRLTLSWNELPAILQEPKTVGTYVLRTILADQYPGSGPWAGAWSRQNDRYLRFYYGDTGTRQHGVSQGASLTFTGMVVERLAAFCSSVEADVSALIQDRLWRAAAYVLGSQDQAHGGFGRRADLRPGASDLHLDIRHTCWAIRALLAIDAKNFAPQIRRGLEWLSSRLKLRNDDANSDDRWCWTTAPLLALLSNPRVLCVGEWEATAASIRDLVQADLESSFDLGLASWLKPKEKEDRAAADRIAVDNALYVLYCLNGCENLSGQLKEQQDISVQRLLSRSRLSTLVQTNRGLALNPSGEPEAGPTAQLLEVMAKRDRSPDFNEFADFVVSSLSARPTMGLTFSWQLSSALVIPDLSNRILAGRR